MTRKAKVTLVLLSLLAALGVAYLDQGNENHWRSLLAGILCGQVLLFTLVRR